MYRTVSAFVLAGVCGLMASASLAVEVTGVTGGSQAYGNMQPSLAMNRFIQTQGIYPTDSGAGDEQFLGCVRYFAGNFGPGGEPFAQGQLLPISQNVALFSLFETMYGGDGFTTFALPDLRGRAGIHAQTGTWELGQVGGVEQVTLTANQMPIHDHTLPPPNGVTDPAGGGEAVSQMQPSLGLNHIIALQGVYPSIEGGTGGMTFLGQVGTFAGDFAPGGWALANGQLLSIAQNPTLFSVLGTTYGGDGVTTFALPDLRGRTAIGAGQGVGLQNWELGETAGAETVTLTTNQLPSHSHTLSPSSDTTGTTGGSQPFDNMQPSLALNYIIATEGIYPPRDSGGTGQTYLGEVTLFAGNYAPGGWALANGQLLPIAQNTALFSLLGTTYGGDGRTTFALPDLRGRTVIGPGQGPGLSNWSLGQTTGTESVLLTELQMPAHAHTYVPEPSALGLLGIGVISLAAIAWRWRAR